MTTDDTQPNLSDIVKGTPKGNKAVQEALVGAARDQEATKSLAELDEILFYLCDLSYASFTTQEEADSVTDQLANDRAEAKQAILDWHNKQVEEVLDRVEEYYYDNHDKYDMSDDIFAEAIEAERNKLKG